MIDLSLSEDKYKLVLGMLILYNNGDSGLKYLGKIKPSSPSPLSSIPIEQRIFKLANSNSYYNANTDGSLHINKIIPF